MKSQLEKDIDKVTAHFDRAYIDSDKLGIQSGKLPIRKIFSQHNPGAIRRNSEFLNSPALNFVRDFYRNLEESLKAPPRDPNLVFDDHQGYCFPTEETIYNYESNSFDKDLPDEKPEENYYINRNYETLFGWVNDLCNSISKNEYTPTIRAIIGKYGCGKSTLIHAIKHGFSEKFSENKIAFSIIPYEKLISTADTNKNEEIKTNIISTIINYTTKEILNKSSILEIIETEGFAKNFIELHKDHREEELLLAGKNHNAESLNEIAKQDLRKLLQKSRGRLRENLSLKHIGRLSDSTKYALIQYLSINGFNFLITIDGLDRLSVSDFVSEQFSNVTHAISQIVFDKDQTYFDEDFPAHFVLTLRNCTYQEFYKREFTTEHTETIRADPIAPVSPRDIISKGIRRIENDANSTKKIELLDKFTDQIFSLIREAFNLDKTSELTEVFNRNYRKLIRFIIDIFEYSINVVIKEEEQPKDIEGLVNQLSAIEGKIKSRKYIIIELLLISKWMGFNNFFNINKTDPTAPQIEHQPNHGNLDNIFNYHIDDKRNKPSPLLIKLRIVQFLSLSEDYRSKDAIIEFLNAIGHDEKELSLTLNILLNADLIKVRMEGSLRYNATTLGKHISNHTIITHEYIEHVTGCTILPRPCSKTAKSYYKYDCGLQRWIQASILNTFIFLQVFKAIESVELKKLADSTLSNEFNLKDFKLSEKLSTSLKNSVSDILHTPVGKRRLPTLDIEESIAFTIEQWRSSNLLDDKQLSLSLGT